MAFLDWRKLNFFDLQKNFDAGKIAETLTGTTVTATTSGFNFLIIGDAEGSIHLVNRIFQITTFRAFNLRVDFLEQSQTSSLLAAIGSDEPGINPLLKIWNLYKTDSHENPLCVRITRAVPTNRNISSAVPASCLCIADTHNLIAIGFADGSINLYRGDITRSKSSKVKTLKKTNRFITSLAFRTTEKNANLFVTTVDSVFLYSISQNDELLVNLDDGSSSVQGKLKPIGCKPKCSTATESIRDCHFMIANEDAIYCYTSDVRGPCYAMDGEKILLSWFRTYLIIVSKNSNMNTSSNDSVTVTILDVHHKLIVCSQNVPSVTAVLIEWGLIFIFTSDLSLHLLAEKHIQARLTLLFKKNLYDVAIRMAKNHQYDTEGLTEIFRQYGDHLYGKGDHQAAIEQYIKTIGNLEPSYVICKFLGSQQIDILTTYLNALHKEKVASGDHTTLLLNCYTKLNNLDKLNSFIMTEDKEVDFDVEVAIKACRGSCIDNALKLAKKHRRHDLYLTIKIEDQQEYEAALDYIARLPFDEATESMKKHGSTLLHYIPSESTQFLKKLCTDFTPKEEENDTKDSTKEKSANVQHANPIDFIPMFLNKSKYLVEFLEHLVQIPSKRSELVYHTLIEHYLRTKNHLADEQVMRLLESSNTCYDKLQVLILCHNHNFIPGMLFFYKENKMYSQILNHHLAVGNYHAVLETCNKFGSQNRGLWLEALFIGARRNCLPPAILTEILSVIEKEKLLSPLLLVEELASCTDSVGVNLGAIRSYLKTVLTNERSIAEKEHALANKYRKETAKIRDRIREIQSNAVVFQSSRCSACNNQLELPSVHFLCQHSFHQHCFQSYAENEKECPACLPNNQPILDIIQSQEKSREGSQTFHTQLETAEDGFSLVAHYFGKRVFRKSALIPDPAGLVKEYKKLAESKSIDKAELDLMPVMNHYASESKFIDMFGSSSQTYTGENHVDLASSLQNSIQNFSSSISSSLENRNFFSNEATSKTLDSDLGYDDSKNPFVNEDTSKNPFLNDDYDDNKNPFV
nr:PREDICTED: vacuolar protein sorting-associated protein 11 homolog isoform X1 [Bemisia tabaci]